MNQLVLNAQLLQRGAVRYTPAGLPAFDICLKHESQVLEAGTPRKVSMEIKAVVIGELSQRVGGLEIGEQACFTGFLAAQRNGRGTVFHITALD
jgi:primosomal replication protein N